MLTRLDLNRLAMLNSARFILATAPADDLPMHEALYAKLNAMRDGQATTPFTDAEQTFLAGLARDHVARHAPDSETRAVFEALADRVTAL